MPMPRRITRDMRASVPVRYSCAANAQSCPPQTVRACCCAYAADSVIRGYRMFAELMRRNALTAARWSGGNTRLHVVTTMSYARERRAFVRAYTTVSAFYVGEQQHNRAYTIIRQQQAGYTSRVMMSGDERLRQEMRLRLTHENDVQANQWQQ